MHGRLLTPAEVSKRTQVSVNQLRLWRKAGQGPPYVQMGPKSARYPEDMLDAWIDARLHGDVPEAPNADEVA